MRAPLVVGFLVVSCCAAVAAAQQKPTRAPGTPLTLDDAVRLALRQNPDLLSARAGLRGAEAQLKAARGAFGPKLKVEGNVMRWDEPLEFSLGGGDMAFQPPAECIPTGPDPPPAWSSSASTTASGCAWSTTVTAFRNASPRAGWPTCDAGPSSAVAASRSAPAPSRGPSWSGGSQERDRSGHRSVTTSEPATPPAARPGRGPRVRPAQR